MRETAFLRTLGVIVWGLGLGVGLVIAPWWGKCLLLVVFGCYTHLLGVIGDR